MTSARIIELCDAVVADLNAETSILSMMIEAKRAYVPVVELKECGTIQVTVVPKEYAVEWASRSTAQTDYQIDIGVMQKIPPALDLDAAFDDLMGLVQEMIDFLWQQARPEDLPGARIINVDHATIFAAEHVPQLRQFTSVFTVTYRLVE